MRRAGSKAGRWSVPGKFISSEHDRGAIHLYLAARPTKVNETGGRKRVLQSPLVDVEIVISEYVINPGTGLKLSKRLGNPVEAMFALDDVARNRDNVRLRVIDVFDQVFEVAACQAAGHVKIGQVSDSQFRRLFQPRNRDLFFVNANA